MRMLGGSSDLTPLLVAAVGLYAGSVPGAVDRLLRRACCSTSRSGTDLGAPSLVLTALGYGVGRYRELRDPAHGLTPIPVSCGRDVRLRLAYSRGRPSCSRSRRR